MAGGQGLSRVQPIYLRVSCPSEVYVYFILKQINTTSTILSVDDLIHSFTGLCENKIV